MKIAHRLLILILILFALNAKSQEYIEYRIVDDTITIKLDRPILKFAVSLVNRSQTNFLLYGFRNSFLVSPEVDSAYVISASESQIGGSRVLLMQGNDRAKIWENINSMHGQDLTGSLQEINNIMIKNSLDNLEVLNGGCSKEVEMSVDLSDYGPLEMGVYSFYLIYSSGALTKETLGHLVTEDKAKYGAELFSGYVMSNQITLVIKR